MARLLIGVSGGIAAYKAVELVRLATKAGHAVRVVQTPTSLRFVGKATFEGVTGAPVLVDEFEADPARGAFPGDPKPEHDPISHLELVRNCDAYVVAPASANTLAKLAAGQADNLLTSAALACTAPLVLAPAMNGAMWANPATVDNVADAARARRAHRRADDRQPRVEGGVGDGSARRARRHPRRDRAAAHRAVRRRDRPADDRRPPARRARDRRRQRAARQARAGDRRRDARADRRRPLRRQPLVGPDGRRARRRGGAPRGRGDARRRQPRASRRPRTSSWSRWRRRPSWSTPPAPRSRPPTCC